MKNKKVLIVGAGPGGLSAGMILAKRGYDVHLYEKSSKIGGRNGSIRLGDYTFDIGPTFLMMPQVLRDTFADAGCDVDKLLDLRRIDPLYRLQFGDGTIFTPFNDQDRMLEEIRRVFPNDEEGYRQFMVREGRKFDVTQPCLTQPYSKIRDLFSRNLMRALPHLDLHLNVYQRLASYFSHEHMRIAMSFQSKYLGMSPWACPAAFTILSYIEHKWGIYHPIGGLNAISHAMTNVFSEHGGTLHVGRPVSKVLVKNGRAIGLQMADGEHVEGDAVVINADFAHAMTKLVDNKDRHRWKDSYIQSRKFSCSTFMIYLGVKRRYDLPHHTIVFSSDYKRNLSQISDRLELPDDPSFYVQNATVTDPSLAPKGKSTLYILVPVPNLQANIDWEKERDAYRDLVIAKLKERIHLNDLEDQIEVEQVITPLDWKEQGSVYRGAVFNLAHTLMQMLYFRPHNKFEDFENCYIVGGGTHPGSGLPTIYESGRICANLISNGSDSSYIS